MSDSKTSEDLFSCQKCGDCCKGFGGTFVSTEDLKAIADYVRENHPELMITTFCQKSGNKNVLAQADNGYCVFWDKMCTIHPVKPRMCRKWPFIESILVDVENWYIMAGSCPGMRTDVSQADILECVRQELNKNLEQEE